MKQDALRSQVQMLLSSESKGRETNFIQNKPSKMWFYRFLKRHPSVSMRKTQDMSTLRAQVTEKRLLVQNCCRGFCGGWSGHFKGRPKKNLQLLNCDETGFPFNPSNTHVLVAKEDKKVYQLSVDSRQQMTVLGCASAGGDLLEPLIIYPGQRFSFDPQHQFPGSSFARSHNGWIGGELCLQ